MQALNGGVYFYGFSAFYIPLVEEFGWSSTALSGAFSLSRLESGVIGPVVGFLIDRFGPRIFMAIGFLMVGTGFVLISQVNSIEMLYLIFVLLLSVGSSMGFSSPVSATVAKWFIKKRSMALGIVMCGVGLGGAVVPLIAWFIGQSGWRNAAVAIGILFLIASLPLSLVMRHRPEDYGYLPDGADPSPVEDEKEQRGETVVAPSETRGKGKTRRVEATADLEVNFTPRQAVFTRTFWLVALVFACRHLVTTGVGVHQIPAVQRMGFSPEFAAGVLAAMTVISIPGRLVFGWLGDRYDKRYLLIVCFALQMIGLIVFAYAHDFVSIVAFLVLYSPAYGGVVPLVPATWGDYFGRRSFATIAGLAQTITMLGTIAGPLIAGYTYDSRGSYEFAFLAFAATNVVGIVLLLFVRRPKLKPAFESAEVQSAI